MKWNTQVDVRPTHKDESLIGAGAKSGVQSLADFIRTTVRDRALFNRQHQSRPPQQSPFHPIPQR